MSPEPGRGRRPALSPIHTRRPPLIYHPRAAWQDFQSGWLSLSMRGRHGMRVRGRVPKAICMQGAGAACAYLVARLGLQLPPPAPANEPQRERKRARGG